MKQKKDSIMSNIWKMYFITALRWFMLFMPIMVIFFQENGLSMKEVLLLQSFYALAIILFEIPSGYLSDVVGRKTSIIIGCVMGFISFGVYSFSYGFWGFLIAEMIMGIGSSFISGSDSAMIYDTMLEAKNEKNYKKIQGRELAVRNFSEATASIIGGFLAVSSLRMPFYVQTGVAFLAIIVACTLIEPKRHLFDEKERNLKGILKVVKYSLNDHKEIKWLIIFSALIGVSSLVFTWLVQPYLKLVGLPLALFGIAWAVFNASVGVFSLSAYRIETFFGRKTSIVSLLFLPVIGYILLFLFQAVWALVFFFIFYFVRGIAVVIFRDYINRLVGSNIRATVLSVRNLCSRLFFAIIAPFVGWITDVYTLKMAYLLFGCFFLFFGGISLLFLKKHEAL